MMIPTCAMTFINCERRRNNPRLVTNYVYTNIYLTVKVKGKKVKLSLCLTN
jgi:hypothetical protein